MAPINLPDGSQVSEIVLPDGSTASEVLAPDGSTVFSAIPDSAVIHHPFVERSTSAIVDEIGNEDGTANGTTNVSGDYDEGYAEDGDGTDDYIELTTLSGVNWMSQIATGPHAISFTVETTDTGAIGAVRDDTDERQLGIRTSSYFNAPNGPLNVTYRVAADNERATVHSDTDITDGTRRRVTLNFPNGCGDPSSWEIWFNGSEDGTTVESSGSPSPSSDFNREFVYFAYNNLGSISNHLNAVMDSWIWHDDNLSSQEIQDDYDRQPWS